MAHRHSNPSPSHCIAAWCNGSGDDPGCGGPIPLYEFRDRRQDEGPYDSYFIDRRDPAAVIKALERLVADDHTRSNIAGSAFGPRIRAAADAVTTFPDEELDAIERAAKESIAKHGSQHTSGFAADAARLVAELRRLRAGSALFLRMPRAEAWVRKEDAT